MWKNIGNAGNNPPPIDWRSGTITLVRRLHGIHAADFLGPLSSQILKSRDCVNAFRNAFLMFPVMAVSAYAQTPRATPVTDRPVDCTEVVEKVLAKTRGRLLSFRPGEEKCTVVILLRKEGKRPEKFVLEIDRDLSADSAEELFK